MRLRKMACEPYASSQTSAEEGERRPATAFEPCTSARPHILGLPLPIPTPATCRGLLQNLAAGRLQTSERTRALELDTSSGRKGTLPLPAALLPKEATVQTLCLVCKRV